MPRRKTSSRTFQLAIKRLASVQSIDPNFDLGNGLNANEYQNAINEVRQALDEYNTCLATVDDKHNTLKGKEKALDDWNERILVGVAAKFGKNSSQYEQAGGIRKSERKRRVAKKGNA